MEFGKLLASLRVERGICQKEIASYLNVSIGTVSNYEKGVHCPDLSTICKLADYYNVTTDYLLGRTGYRSSLDCLNLKIADEYTTADLLNTTLELNPRNQRSLMDFIELINLRNQMEKEP